MTSAHEPEVHQPHSSQSVAAMEKLKRKNIATLKMTKILSRPVLVYNKMIDYITHYSRHHTRVY